MELEIYQLLLLGFSSVAAGFFIMKKHKFYNFDSDDWSFDTKLKIFIGGFLLFLLGIVCVIKGVYDIFG